MAEHQRVNEAKKGDEDQRHRTKRQDSQPLFDQSLAWDIEPLSLAETPFHPRINEHAAILSRIPFSAQRREFMMQLHQTYGNRYVQRLLNSKVLQAKLTVSNPNDIYEQEADRAADAVARGVNSQIQRQPVEEEEEPVQTKAMLETQRQAVPEEEEEVQTKPLLQRQAEPEEEEEVQAKLLLQRQAEPEEEEEVQTKPLLQRQAEPEEEEEVQAKLLLQRQAATISGNLENSIKAAQGSGHLLSDDVREPMEQAFNKDFSEVRVHTDSEADMLSQQLSARAFTTGQDVFFREGEYSPGSDSGRELIAHELTHTVQQTGGKKPQRHPVEEETQMKLDTPRSIIEGGHVNQEMESDLQQARGNTQSPDGSVQRMAIIVADDMNDETDTLVWNNLENAKREAGGPVGDLSAHKVWDQLGKNEAIRLVGHGKEDKPEIVPDIKTTDIVKSMTEGTETLDTPDNVKIKEVTFQSCYAGIGPVNTMVGEMKDLLEGKGYHGVTVKGRTGVAFGFKGMGEKTGETTKGGTYIKDPGALNFYTVNYPDILNEDKGTQVYCEAMYLCRNYKTKTTNVDIFKTPFEPCGYNDPWYIIKISEPEWDTWTASKRSKFVAREMEPYWKEVKRIMKGGGGFKAKGEILTKKTYVKRLAGVLDKIAKKFGIY